MLVTLTGVPRGVIGAEEEDDDAPEKKRKSTARMILQTDHGERVLEEVHLPAGFAQNSFELDKVGYFNCFLSSPKKGRLRAELVEIVGSSAPWKGNGKGRHHEPAEPLAITQ